MRVNFITSLLSCALMLTLTACGVTNDHQDLRDYIAEKKRRPPGQIDPLPTFRPYQSFAYSSVALRSPFDQPVSEQEKVLLKGNSNVKPDLNREKEYLEGFNISSLTMVGTLKRDNVLWALINDGAGAIHRVKKGNFLGKNHGKIVDASENQIDIIEIVPNGVDGWVERPKVIQLEEQE